MLCDVVKLFSLSVPSPRVMRKGRQVLCIKPSPTGQALRGMWAVLMAAASPWLLSLEPTV